LIHDLSDDVGYEQQRRRETKIKQEIANLKSQLTILKSPGANGFN